MLSSVHTGVESGCVGGQDRCEVSFTRHFYKPQPLRSLDEVRRDIPAWEAETEGLLGEIVGASGHG